MKNPKKIGNEYERHICSIIEEMLGVEFKRTKYSGGDLHPGDIRDWTQSTPLSKYCQEIKYHGSQKAFNRDFKDNIRQAITQTPANKNWQLIIHLPKTDIELVVMDFKDYLCNDIKSQMEGKKEVTKVDNYDNKRSAKEIEYSARKILQEVKKL